MVFLPQSTKVMLIYSIERVLPLTLPLRVKLRGTGDPMQDPQNLAPKERD